MGLPHQDMRESRDGKPNGAGLARRSRIVRGGRLGESFRRRYHNRLSRGDRLEPDPRLYRHL